MFFKMFHIYIHMHMTFKVTFLLYIKYWSTYLSLYIDQYNSQQTQDPATWKLPQHQVPGICKTPECLFQAWDNSSTRTASDVSWLDR